MNFSPKLLIFLFQTFAISSFACSLAGKSIGKFDDTEYVFIGEVVGYTERVASSKLIQAGYGLVVKPNEVVHLPKATKKHFEVFSIELWADCSFGGKSISNLKRDFAIGSEVRVIAKESEIFPASSDGNIRLEDRPGEIGSISLNLDDNGSSMTNTALVFDYKSYTYDMDRDADSKHWLPDFEIRKDLHRLEKTKDVTERRKILDRLSFAPVFSSLNFYELFNHYSRDQTEADELFEHHLSTTDPDIFKQYKELKKAEAELLKLGYDKETIESALGKALSEGTAVKSDALVARAKEILGQKINKPQ